MGPDGKKREERGKKSERAVPEVLTPPVTARESRSMVNARSSSTKSRAIVNPDCPFVFEACTGRILKPLPSARFEFVGNISDFERETEESLISVAEAAKRIGLKPKTLYCWIEGDRLRADHGLRTLGKRHRIDWAIFKGCLDRGEFAGSDSSCS
jgi:hypothetical protein